MTPRTLSEFRFILSALAGETLIHALFLMENDELPELIKSGVSFEDLLEFVNENY